MDKVVDVLGVQVSQLLGKTVVFPQFLLVEKKVEIPHVFLDNVVDMPVGVSTLCRENCGVSAVAAHRQGLGAEVDELRCGFCLRPCTQVHRAGGRVHKDTAPKIRCRTVVAYR